MKTVGRMSKGVSLGCRYGFDSGLTLDYVRGVIRLIESGEDRLLKAVEAGHVPVSVALRISEADDEGTQRLLQEAYETKALRGRKFLIVKRLIAQRRRHGKTADARKRSQPLSVDALLRTYKQDTDKKRLLVRKAEATGDRLVFATEALRKLYSDANFCSLLRVEGLDSLPKNLGDRLGIGLQA